MLKKQILISILYVFVTLFWSSCALTAESEEDNDPNQYTIRFGLNQGTAGVTLPGDDKTLTTVDPQPLLGILQNEGNPVAEETNHDIELLSKVAEDLDQITREVKVDRTWIQTCSGLSVLFVFLPIMTVVIPSFLGTLGADGMNNKVIPDSGAAELVLTASAFLMPFLVGSVAIYKGVSDKLSSKSCTRYNNEICNPCSGQSLARAIKIPFKATCKRIKHSLCCNPSIDPESEISQRPYSCREKFVYSSFVSSYQLLFYTTIYFAPLMLFETRNLDKDWGSAFLWTLGFTGFYTIPLYLIYVLSNNNPNNHPFRYFINSDDQKDYEQCIDMVKAVERKIQNEGITKDTTTLALKMNVLYSIPQVPNDRTPLMSSLGIAGSQTSALMVHRNDDPALQEASRGVKRLRSQLLSRAPEAGRGSEDLLVDVQEKGSLGILQEMKAIDGKTPQKEKDAHKSKEKVALGTSSIYKIIELPLRTIWIYGLQYYALQYVFLPTNAMYGSAAITAVTFPLIAGVSYKELSLIYYGTLSFLKAYKPNSIPYWGARITSGIAVVGAIGYFGLSPEYFLRNYIWEGILGITNFPVQLGLSSLSLVTAFEGGRRLASSKLGIISDWVRKGMEFSFCCRFKICKCCDSDHEFENGMDLLDKVTRIRELLENTNPELVIQLNRKLQVGRPTM